MSERIYSNVINNEKVDSVIRDINVIKNAVDMFKENMLTFEDKKQNTNNIFDLLNNN